MRINDYNPAMLLAWQGNMDIQFIGENSSVLNWYCTKYCTKPEKSHALQEFDDINKSTKSITSKLWNFAMKSISHRECGALEACDTLLGIPLFVTDPNTTIRWVDVNMVRSRRLKEKSIIEGLEGESSDIFFPSWVDSHYPNRPEQLENVCLYNFLAYYDLVQAEPIRLATYYPFKDGFLKKRTRPYLINHYKHNIDQEVEKYYYAILLLFKPWRNSETLIGSSESFQCEFENCREQLPDAVNYHNRLQQMQKRDEIAREQIDKRRTEIEQEEDGTTEVHAPDTLLHAHTEAQDAMAEFEEVVANEDIVDVESMIESLNEDQRRVFDRVSTHLQAQHSSAISNHPQPLCMFVSGCGGTGKSFLIKTLKAWIHSSLEKHAAITAPTGIAAFNVNGLTIHRLLQLPVEHGKTPKYRSLSDEAIKIVRQKLQQLVLLIVDEVSMVSHVTLLYIHLRLTEIFNTGDIKNGWFGCKNILVFGDLLQLPPVFEQPVYTTLTSATVHKHTDSPGGVDIWQLLFEYDELVINMRQRDNRQFTELLGRVRLGKLTVKDIKTLNQRKLSLKSPSISGRMKEVVDELLKLPEDTVCLLPTRSMCTEINIEVLSRLPGEEYKLVAEDSVDCSRSILQKVKAKLTKCSEDCTQTAGLENIVHVKIGCKVMLRRNIDVSQGLVNGAIGTVQSIQRSIEKANKVESITIKFQNNQQHLLKRVSTKFEVFDRAFVIRSQFPITAASAITIHKSQGLTLKHVVTDIGNTVFSCGQAYVALSRVTSLDGLYLINFDPRSVKALDSAILEYNRLRLKHRPTLAQFSVTKQRPKKVDDIQWCTIPWTSAVQRPAAQAITLKRKGFVNKDGVSSYANSVMQCVLFSPVVRRVILDGCDGAIKSMCRQYVSNADTTLDCTELRQELGSPFDGSTSQDALKFLILIMVTSFEVHLPMHHTVNVHTRCRHCGRKDVDTWTENVVELHFPESCKSIKFDDLMKFSLGWMESDSSCKDCHGIEEVRKDIIKAGSVLVFRMNVCPLIKGKTFPRKTSVTAVSSSTFVIDGQKYKLMAAVSEVATSARPGYEYKAILSISGKWLHCSDLSTSVENWPRGSKGVYLLFYHAVSTVPPPKDAVGHSKKHVKAPESVKPPKPIKPHVKPTMIDLKAANSTTANNSASLESSSSVAGAATTTTDSAHVKNTTEFKTSRVDTANKATDSTVKNTKGHAGSKISGPGPSRAGATARSFKSCVPFKNTDGVSCYANSVLQSLLQHGALRSAFIASRYRALQDLSNSYNYPSRTEVLSSRQVRRMLGAPFSVRSQQDASEFLINICMYCRTIENCLNLVTRTSRRCTSCPYTSSSNQNDVSLLLTIPEGSSTNVTLSSMFAMMQSWVVLEGSHCTTCNDEGAVLESRQQLIQASDLIVVQLKLYIYRGGVVHKMKVSVDDVTHFTLMVEGTRYRVKNVICHHGPSATSGHYTSYHKQERGWILANDSQLTRVDSPNTEKDVYILFFAKD
ncbi:uncharacterized protein [Dysidea avara]|uniref:uncharacterized protein n=1 Tax=Dysidea avara TaxID=196820 RepID=UPI00332AF36D